MHHVPSLTQSPATRLCSEASIEVKINDTETGLESEKDTETQQSPESRREIGGPKGLEPTRYGDWEVNGRCSDF